MLDPKMHSMIRRLLERFGAAESNVGQVLPRPSSDRGFEGQILMLSPHDVAGLLGALYPKLKDPGPSANPSTAGSSTLVPESVRFGQGNNPSTPSLSELSIASARIYKTGPPQHWAYYVESNGTGVDSDVTALSSLKSSSVRPTEDRVYRTYSHLMSIMQPLPAASSVVSSPDWAFFRTDDEGKVQWPHYDRAPIPENNHASSDRHYYSAKIDNTSSQYLKSSISRLLDLRVPPSTDLHQGSRSERVQPAETRFELDNLVKAALDRAMTTYDHQELHYWWQVQQLLQDYEGCVDGLLQWIYEDCQQSIRVNEEISSRIDKQLYGLSELQDAQNSKLLSEQRQRKALRMKMWYAVDVRHSSTFEDALHITQALRAMADMSRSKQPTGVANWARNRLRSAVGHDRTSAQTLEAMTEPNEHSGTSKLNDDQAERTTRWLTKQSVENFCRGEERIHRFCLEIQKCVNKLTGPTLLESPVLWSSALYDHEKRAFIRKTSDAYEQHLQRINKNISSPSNAYSPASLSTLTSQQRHSISQNSTGGHLVRPSETLDPFPFGSLKNQSFLNEAFAREPVRSLPFQISRTSSLSSDSVRSSYRSEQEPKNDNGARESFIAEMKTGACSLILSDLGYLLWHSGAETDTWLRQASLDESLLPPDQGTAGVPLAEIHKQRLEEQVPDPSRNTRKSLEMLLTAATTTKQDSRSRWRPEHSDKPGSSGKILYAADHHENLTPFPYSQTYKAILERFSLSNDPRTKLRMLHELEQIVSCSIQDASTKPSSTRAQFQNHRASTNHPFHSKNIVVPRTKATSFEEVIANCTERRAGTLRFKNSRMTSSAGPEATAFGTDEIVNTLLSVFRNSDLRPPTLFRDLQYIAAFVPAEILDQTPQGKAFWDAGLAALALKQDLCDAMIVRATNITTYHISASSSSPDPLTSIPGELAHTSLRDAAQLWTIAAKEGSATAARELGLLYLTHPELLPRTTLQPFAKPKEVFKTVGAKKEGLTAEEGRLDPVTFAVVFHWMEVAANGGDKDARDFLRGNGEWGVGR
ncbi:MAG: hypothetical protein Q9200_001575 [Gallowayella weberi]